MKGILTAVLFGLCSFSAFADNTEIFLDKHYPYFNQDPSNPCRLMSNTENEMVCISDVIVKDFRSSGDHLYYVVLGGEDRCLACQGAVDLYAYTKSGNIIKEKEVMGKWGYPPGQDSWEFIQQKTGKVVISIDEVFCAWECVCVETQFSVSNSKFVSKTETSKCGE